MQCRDVYEAVLGAFNKPDHQFTTSAVANAMGCSNAEVAKHLSVMRKVGALIKVNNPTGKQAIMNTLPDKIINMAEFTARCKKYHSVKGKQKRKVKPTTTGDSVSITVRGVTMSIKEGYEVWKQLDVLYRKSTT